MEAPDAGTSLLKRPQPERGVRVAIGHVADRYFPIGARSFARLLGADDYQGAGIDFFPHQPDHRYIYLLDDGQGTGYAGADYASAAAMKVGLTVSGSATWSPSAHNYRGLAARIARSGADSVVLSGYLLKRPEAGNRPAACPWPQRGPGRH